jgi:hypothetical protein
VPISRRAFLEKAVAGAALLNLPVAYSRADESSSSVSPVVLRGALNALERHAANIPHRDVIGIADFSLPSSAPRFHLLTVADGRVRSHLVAHGRGSDPGHTGWLERFSNEPHSYATSAGAFRTQDMYLGEHGQSIRLEGLDGSNSNAASRAIVVHGAWYVSDEIAKDHGVLGRSEGCFAVAPSSIADVLSSLGSGRLIYAGKT